MSGVIGDFAENISEAARQISAIGTADIEGDFGDELRKKQSLIVATLEGVGTTLNDLQTATDEHRRSEETFISTAPTLADIDEAQTTLESAQTVRAAVDSGAVAPVAMGLDLVQMDVIEQAQQQLTQLVEQRRQAVSVFLGDQDRLASQIRNIELPTVSSPMNGRLSGTEPPTGSTAPSLSAPVPGLPRSSVPRTSGAEGSGVGAGAEASAGASGSNGAASAGGDPGMAPVVTPVPAVGTMGTPQLGAFNPTALAGRIGPPVMPGYTIPGTTVSAGTPTPMSDREFNSLLDRIKGDRAGLPSTTPTMPSGAGGVTGGAASAPRVVQPSSWLNASTSPTGVSEGQNGRGTTVPSSTSSAAAQPRSGMPMMGPMAPGGANPDSGGRDPKDQPKIINADPDVYGDDVQTIDPIIDNQRGRFS